MRPNFTMAMSLLSAVIISALIFGMSAKQEDKHIMAELDAFSGRPNPQWILTAEDATEFLARFQDLPQSQERFPSGGLGYRGIKAKVESLMDYEDVSIYKGVVLARSGDRSSRFADEGRSFELWLLGTGKGFLSEEFYEQIVAEIIGKEPKSI